MVALVTGASGFLGTHLVSRLRKEKYEVVILPHKLLDDPGAITYKLRDTEVDYIFHLASYGNYHTQKNDFEIVHANIIRTHNLLQATKAIPYKGFIYVSSSSVYGRKIHPMDENDLLEPETTYASSKAGAEHISRAFALQYKKPVVIARPFTIYGPGDSPVHLIPTVINAIKKGKELNLDPVPSHDYIYVDDVVSGLVKIKDEGLIYPGTTVNIGTGIQYTNIEVVEHIQKIMGKKPVINLIAPMRPYDSLYWVADINLAQFLGVASKYSFEEGLKCTIKI